MSVAELKAVMEAAQADVERVCVLLVNPALPNLAACQSALGTAFSRLSSCAVHFDGFAGDATLLAQAAQLRQAIRHTDCLLQTAAAHRQRWFQILRSKMGGYTAQGEPPEISGASQVFLRG
jgi:hypothetical protein